MENNIDLEIAQAAFLEEKSALSKKIRTFSLCLAVFFVLIKLMNMEASIFRTLKEAFYLTLVMYLPFKICYKSTGSIVSSLIGSVIIVLVVGLVLGDSSPLLGWVLFGGMAVDFGWSIYRLWTLKQSFPNAVQ